MSAAALADAMELFLIDAELRTQLLEGVAQTQAEFSTARFFQSVTAHGADNNHADSLRK
jgi:hypothetical protein